MTLVKVCGITCEEELEMARQADHVGLVVNTGTRRSLDPSAARRLRDASSVPTVMVTTAPTVEEVLRLAALVKPAAVQTYRLDAEEVAEIRERGYEVWAAVAVGVPGDLEMAMRMSRAADAVVLDSPSPQGGGSGTVHDWERSAAIRRRVDVPVVLAGGLGPHNAAAAVRTVRPDEVDASSGLEVGGRKDADKVRRFIEEVRRCLK